jgi:predicted dehydrogenase
VSKFGIGIIGTGDIAGDCHVPAIKALDNSMLVAVLSRDKSRGKEFLRVHNQLDAEVYTTLEHFVADPKIDMVIICSPDGLHAQHATVCLGAGKHVLLEKPMATSLEEAKELVQLADGQRLILATGFHLRFHSGHNTAFNDSGGKDR